jgi:hypothetical protein
MQREQLTAEREATRAEVNRLRAREEAVGEEALTTEAEEALLRQLADLRDAFAGRADDAEIDPARAALARTFECCTLHRLVDNGDGTGDWPTYKGREIDPGLVVHGAHLIELHPKGEAIEEMGGEGLMPALRRIPLAHAGATGANALPT